MAVTCFVFETVAENSPGYLTLTLLTFDYQFSSAESLTALTH